MSRPAPTETLGRFARAETNHHLAERAQLPDSLSDGGVTANFQITDVLNHLLGDDDRNADQRLGNRPGGCHSRVEV